MNITCKCTHTTTGEHRCQDMKLRYNLMKNAFNFPKQRRQTQHERKTGKTKANGHAAQKTKANVAVFVAALQQNNNQLHLATGKETPNVRTAKMNS